MLCRKTFLLDLTILTRLKTWFSMWKCFWPTIFVTQGRVNHTLILYNCFLTPQHTHSGWNHAIKPMEKRGGVLSVFFEHVIPPKIKHFLGWNQEFLFNLEVENLLVLSEYDMDWNSNSWPLWTKEDGIVKVEVGKKLKSLCSWNPIFPFFCPLGIS